MGFLHINVRAIALFLLLLVALYVVLARSLLALVPEYRGELQSLLSEQLGVPVVIGALDGEWIGFDPVVVIRELSLSNPDFARVDEVRIRLAVFRSLLAREIRLRSIQIDQSQLVVAHESEDVWLIGGENWASTSPDSSSVSPRLLRMFDGAQVVLANTQLEFIDLKQRHSTWRLPDLSVYYRGDDLHARGRVLEPGGVQSLLNFSMRGTWREEQGLIGQIYSEFRSGANLASMLKEYRWSDIAIQEVDASGRLWLDFEGWAIASWQGNIQLSELQWLVKEESMPPVQNLSAEVHWERSEGATRLAFSRLGFEWFGYRCGPMSGRVDAQGAQQRYYLDALSIPCVTQLVTALDLPSEQLRERLEVSEPEGMLRRVHVVLPESEPWRFDAELDGVSLKAYESTPAGKGISGHVFAHPEGGGVIFDSPGFELAFPRLFLDAWQTRHGQGAVYWRLGDDEIEVYSDGIRLAMMDGALVYGDFALRLNGDAHEDYLALQIALQDIDFKNVPDFVPYYAVGSDLHDWLRTALQTGNAGSGIYVGYGAVEENNPENSFTSSIFVDAQQGALKVAEGWPLLEELDARIDIQNGQLDIAAERGQMGPTRLKHIRAHKPEAEDGKASTLVAKATSNIAPNQLAFWLKESPIAVHTRTIADQIEVNSVLNTSIEIGVPMAGDAPVSYDIRAHMDDARLRHVPSRLDFSALKGELQISSGHGIHAEGIRGRLFEQDIIVDIGTHPAPPVSSLQAPKVVKGKLPGASAKVAASVQEVGQEAATDTRITMQGFVDHQDLLTHFALQSPPGLSGGFDYLIELVLPAHQQPPYFVVRSNLKGLRRDWPEPFAKSVDQSEQLQVKTTILESGLALDVTLQSDDFGYGHAVLDILEGRLQKGWLGIDQNVLEAPSEVAPGFTADIRVDRARISPWLAFIENSQQQKEQKEREQTPQPFLRAVNLDVAHLHAYGYVFSRQKVAIEPVSEAWNVTLAGTDAAGTIRVPTNQKDLDLELDFEHLHLSKPDVPDAAQVSDPRALPGVRFSAARLRLDEQDYGSLSFRIEPGEEGAIFRDLRWRLLQSKADGQLNWRYQNGVSESILTLDLEGEDIDALARHLAWKSPLTSSKLQGKVAWVWPAAPHDFALGRVSGSLDVRMEEGRLKTADEKTGALRLFGIFNAEALGRRLKLDFSDLYKSGVTYDELYFKARIDQGNLKIEDRLVIEGPSSKYAIKGNADLGKETLDMEMVVELPVSQNVPLAALLLGAPQIGGAVWLIDKLLGEPLSQITTARYSIKGPWKDPVLELKQVLNADK